jgi:L-threonylcarbamoyladenylate synthase
VATVAERGIARVMIETGHTWTLPLDDSARWREEALGVLRGGGIVAVPTETVYGLAGDATNAAAVAAIYAAKGRPSHNPLIVHVSDRTMAEAYAVMDARAKLVADAFWPGPLTLVLPHREPSMLAPAVTAGNTTLAIRAPRGPLRELADALGHPLAAPSANRSGHVSSSTAAHVLADLEGRIPLILDGGATDTGLESTIVDLSVVPARILRPGGVTAEALSAFLGEELLIEDAATVRPSAPGLLASHYAPRASVRLNVLPADLQPGEAYLGFGQHHVAGGANLSPDGDPGEAARRLYALMRAADASHPAGIAVAPLPSDGVGAALLNRLQRAAAPRG